MVSNILQCVLSLAIAGGILYLVWCHNHQVFTDFTSYLLAGFRYLLHDAIERATCDVTRQLQQDTEHLIGPSWRSGTVADVPLPDCRVTMHQAHHALLAMAQAMTAHPDSYVEPYTPHQGPPLSYTPLLEDEPVYSKEGD